MQNRKDKSGLKLARSELFSQQLSATVDKNDRFQSSAVTKIAFDRHRHWWKLITTVCKSKTMFNHFLQIKCFWITFSITKKLVFYRKKLQTTLQELISALKQKLLSKKILLASVKLCNFKTDVFRTNKKVLKFKKITIF